MPVYRDKQTGRFFIQFQLNGEPYKQRLHAGITRRAAETLEVRIKNQLLFEQHGVAARQDHTFENFIQEVYLPQVEADQGASALSKAIVICKAALQFFKGKQMRAIKPADIERFKVSRMALKTMHGKERQPATVARELSIISAIFREAVKNDVCEINPCSRVQKPSFDNVQNRVLRPEDEAKFFGSFDKEQGRTAHDVCRVVLHTGLRQNDILGLSKFQVDLEARLIRLVQGKTKRLVEIRMSETVFQILNRRMSETKGELLFPSEKNNERLRSIRTAIAGACTRAGIERLTIRDLRRTCSTRLDNLGFSTATIAKHLGHADLRSVLRYQRGRAVLDDAVNALEKFSQSATILPMAARRKAN
jgi:integrase